MFRLCIIAAMKDINQICEDAKIEGRIHGSTLSLREVCDNIVNDPSFIPRLIGKFAPEACDFITPDDLEEVTNAYLKGVEEAQFEPEY